MPNTRTIAGILVVGGIMIGAFLGGYLPDFTTPGLGPGEGISPTDQPELPTDPDEPAPEVGPVVANDVVDVLIDGREYLLQDSGKTYPTSLERVVELAQNAQGDEDGVRIRISRRSSSRTTTEMALRERLLSAGIDEEAIRWAEGLLP